MLRFRMPRFQSREKVVARRPWDTADVDRGLDAQSWDALMDGLHTAFPRAEIEVEDRSRVPEPVNRFGEPGVPQLLLEIVLPVATSAAVSAVIDIAVAWLKTRMQRFERGEEVVIYGPRGKRIRTIRRRSRFEEPEIF